MPQDDHISQDVATLRARSEHSQESRSYLTMRIDDLTAAVNGPDGLSVRLVRLEERLQQQQRVASRRTGWLIGLAPVVTLALEALLKALVSHGR